VIVDNPSETSANASDPCQPAAEGIAECAYFIWLSKGRPEGKALEHWTEAEEQLRVGC
jgi:hypothetical protein